MRRLKSLDLLTSKQIETLKVDVWNLLAVGVVLWTMWSRLVCSTCLHAGLLRGAHLGLATGSVKSGCRFLMLLRGKGMR